MAPNCYELVLTRGEPCSFGCLCAAGVGEAYGRFFRIARTSVELAAVSSRFWYIFDRARLLRLGLKDRSMTLPVPVIRTRLAVPLWVFIFGTRVFPSVGGSSWRLVRCDGLGRSLDRGFRGFGNSGQ